MTGLFGGLLGGSSARAQDAAALPSYPAHMDDAAIDAVFERATAETDTKTATAITTWAMDQSRWDADLEAGTLTFTNPRGWRIVAPVQVVGTRNTADGSFLWGWDHPSVPVPLRADAKRVRAFGAAQGLAMLTTRMVEASEEDAWNFTALALHLSGAQGAYRGPAGSTHVLMTFGAVAIHKG